MQRLHRFIVTDVEFAKSILPKEESHHFHNVLRGRVGDLAEIHNIDNAKNYLVKIVNFSDFAEFEIISEKVQSENCIINIFFALCKNDINDLIIEKATELGVNNICFFSALRSQEKLSISQFEKKHSRWKRIAIAALKQSGCNKIPNITYANSLEQCLKKIETNIDSYKLIFTAPNANLSPGESLNKLNTTININHHDKASLPVYMIIGPEGGLTDEEINSARQKSFVEITLGQSTLRAETAAIVAIGSVKQFLL